MCILTPRERSPEEKDEEVDPGTDVGHLASEGDRPQGDDKEQVGNVGLDALPMKNLALTRAGEKNRCSKAFGNLNDSLASLVDDLLE